MKQKNSPLLSKKVALSTGHESRVNNSTTTNTANEADGNLTDRTDKFMDLISQKNTYRIPLRLLTNIDLVNHPIKLDTFICYLETDLTKLLTQTCKSPL